MIDKGSGPALLVIPGIQGRWEWMAPAIDALSATYRVLSFSLTDVKPLASGHFHSQQQFDAWEHYMDAVLDRAGVRTMTLVGVSFGGILAARYAARRADRVRALILVSTPPPRWKIGRRRQAYLRHPVLLSPLFLVRSLMHLLPEVVAAKDAWSERLSFLAGYIGRTIRFPISPRQMADWVRIWQTIGDPVDSSRITAPTLIITGEPGLDRVVPPESTLEYLRLIPHARHRRLERTGHIGLVSRPEAFAQVVGEFLQCV